MCASWHALHDGLVRSTGTLRFQKEFLNLRAGSPIARFPDPAALLDHLHAPGGDPEEKNTLLRALAVAASGERGESAVTLLLLALWPGLDAARGRLARHFRGRGDELAAEIVGRASIGIRRLDADRVTRIAATLVRNTERDVRRMLAARRAAAEDDLPEDLADRPPAPPSRLGLPEGAPDAAALLLLDRRLTAVIGAETELVLAIAVGEADRTEIAARLGLTCEALKKRWQRALRRLRVGLELSP